ncbi:FAS1-like dehydratase domain-containing protein [Rhodovulum sp. YNF3179]|uniref:FAS1-like dehydratase domain-containing protein n=1 Tax=Rhodovulum sp. YNF3179 TaxID=3425127 RepID=UPI003D348338
MHEAEGTRQTRIDVMDPARAAALHAALGRPGPAPEAGDPLPPFGHHLHFWEARPPAALGRDGHPATGGFIPDLGLPRRMWAGGRLDFAAPVRLGAAAERISTIARVTRKRGRTGPLAFVTLRHEIRQHGRVCVTEDQDLVYREDPDPSAPAPVAPAAPTDEDVAERATYDTTLLFRYSALTFNGHRIHYDLAYCREVEGYPGLVVHGPLLAQQLMLMAEARLDGLARFSFRATAPLFHFETATLCARTAEDGLALWVRGSDGRLCLTAEAG